MKRHAPAVAIMLMSTACQDGTGPKDVVVGPPELSVATARITDLGTLPGGTRSQAFNINERGQIVGLSDTDVGTFRQHAFLWEKGTMIDLGVDEDDLSIRFAINNLGQVGIRFEDESGDEHVVLWQDGVITDLGTLGGCCTFSFDGGINERGQGNGPRACARTETQTGKKDTIGYLDGFYELVEDEGDMQRVFAAG